ncbi:hypothetical protein EK21DRAFT_106261 [Setomelanomma holmii]|uniref:Uncharacterized protein n=1 Tax=Setomelanomma holmii TaxID=210430 RepID=A0A9P4HKD0_9PLEO|nr:hypothetical protein EK21DRAFT_106261 [Setomelanomma holmii]
MRAVCREINAKLTYFYGANYCKEITIALDEHGIQRVAALSKGLLRLHVERITIVVDTLYTQIVMESESETTDASLCSWYSQEALYDMNIYNCKCEFDESVANLIADGRCIQILGQALPELLEVKKFHICLPDTCSRIVPGKMKELERRWLMASKVLLAALFTAASALDQLEVNRGCHALPIPFSALDVATMHCPQWSGSMREMKLNIVNDLERDLAIHVHCLTLDCDTIINKHEFDHSNQSSDFDMFFWYDASDNDYIGDLCVMKLSSDDPVMDILKYRVCSNLLGSALRGLSSVKEFQVQQPGVARRLNDKKVPEWKFRWTAAVNTLFSIAIPQVTSLEALGTRRSGGEIDVGKSNLRSIAVCQNINYINLQAKEREVNHPETFRILRLFFESTPMLDDLQQGFGFNKYGAEFFKQLYNDFDKDISDSLKDHMNLKELTLRCVKYDDSDFGADWFSIDKQKFREKEITLKAKNGDDMRFWLDEIY